MRWTSDFRFLSPRATSGGNVPNSGFWFSLSMGVVPMTTQDILAKVASGEIKPDEAAKLISALNGNGKGGAQITYKVSEKGALSAYGLQRMPVTLYVQQWERLDSEAERKRRADFIKANAKNLVRK